MAAVISYQPNLAYPVHKDAGVESPPPSPTGKADVPLASRFKAQCHPLEPEVTKQVNEYFLTHWPFKDDKARKKFVAAGFSYVTCLYFPMAKDDRIQFACKLLTLLFLIDGTHIYRHD